MWFTRETFWIALVSVLALSACGAESKSANRAAPTASDTHTNHIASAVLNVAQSEDILHSSKQAMHNITASDIAAASQAMMDTATPLIVHHDAIQAASLPADVPPLPERCQHYFARAQSCFQKQHHADGLINMLQQQQMDLAQDSPDAIACDRLYRSFDDVAHHLACE